MKPKFKVGDEVRLRTSPPTQLLHDDEPGDILRVVFIEVFEDGFDNIEYYVKKDDEPYGARIYFENELESPQEYYNEQKIKKLLGVE